MNTWLVMLTTSRGTHIMYVVAAQNEDIARDKCIRSWLVEQPNDSFRESIVYPTDITNPLKILQD